jgi:glycosyltransferase involved in cell wall biosynthesis
MDSSPTKWPRISLVTPSLNAEATIERTLLSIELQGYPNLQVICVDGGSRDKTLNIIERYRHIVTNLICGKDKNVADAVNKGFAIAEGEIFGYLNADDALVPGALERVAQTFAAETDVDVITGGCRRVFADSSEVVTQVPENFLDTMSMRNNIEQPSTFWRAAVHRRLGEFDDSYQLAFDWEWWNRLHAAGARFKRIPDVLSVYYFSKDNLTSKAGHRVIEEMYRVTKTYGPFDGKIADVYRMLYRFFDLRGYYDRPFRKLSPLRRMMLGGTLLGLYSVFGRQAINAYNWNWASKQVRGLVWYK